MTLRREGAQTVLVLEHAQVEATLGMRYLARWGRILERFERELA
jgi:hypothetical protein